MTSVIIKLQSINSNGTILNKGNFNIKNHTARNSCAKKIIDLTKNGHTTSDIIPLGNTVTYNDVVHVNQGEDNMLDIDGPDLINSVSHHLYGEIRNRTLTFKKDTIQGGNNKEYVKLQSGGRRLLRYGSRGGRYYMKGGKRNYVK